MHQLYQLIYRFRAEQTNPRFKSTQVYPPLGSALNCTYLDKVEETRGNWPRLSRWGPSWSSLRRLVASLVLWLKNSSCSEERASWRSGHSSLSWLKKGSSPNRLVKAPCWDIMSVSEDSSQEKLGFVFKALGCKAPEKRQRREFPPCVSVQVVWDMTRVFSPLYTPAVPIRPSLFAIYSP